MRRAKVARKTKETNISIEINLDGTGVYSVKTGIGFMDHMLELFSKHSLIDLKLSAKGDLQVDYHHTVEDIGIALGEALDSALGTRKGINRYGCSYVPMDEALCRTVIDLGGRPKLVKAMVCKKQKIRDFDVSLIDEFLEGFVVKARMNLHIDQLKGGEAHHAYESVFKSFARALRQACERDSRNKSLPSSKGKI
ncbi:imidazoleglycerol-phosphate dehydratase [bacterium E08(2017)]|nr:imidazoleglycerol-phosphate dehydratase [bacterium E08(2017)]